MRPSVVEDDFHWPDDRGQPGDTDHDQRPGAEIHGSVRDPTMDSVNG